MLDTMVSEENGGEKAHGGEKVPLDHEPEDEGEICGEVRGERPNQGAGEMGDKLSEEQLLISLPARFCLSMLAGAETVRSHIEELWLSFCPLILPLLSLLEGGEQKQLFLGT